LQSPTTALLYTGIQQDYANRKAGSLRLCTRPGSPVWLHSTASAMLNLFLSAQWVSTGFDLALVIYPGFQSQKERPGRGRTALYSGHQPNPRDTSAIRRMPYSFPLGEDLLSTSHPGCISGKLPQQGYRAGSGFPVPYGCWESGRP